MRTIAPTTIDTHTGGEKSEKMCIELNVAEEAANTVLFKSKSECK
jgi:hypothetical protein